MKKNIQMKTKKTSDCKFRERRLKNIQNGYQKIVGTFCGEIK